MTGGLNLHDIVRPIITFVNPDETAALYQSAGQVNRLGKIVPVYLAPVEVKVQYQPLDAETLRQIERVSDTKADGQLFLYSDPENPVAGIQKLPKLRTGDFVQRSNGLWYLITAVTKDWNERGWANVTINLQLTPPDFSACDWYQGDGG